MPWYVLYTKPRWEKKVAGYLSQAGIDHYCPLNKVMRQWSDRKKLVLEPLFRSYVFVHLSEEDRYKALEIKGAVNFLFWNKKPGIVRDEEIDLIKKMLDEYEDIQISPLKEVSISDSVTIQGGPFTGMKANIIAISKNSVKVIIPSLRCEMIASIPKNKVTLNPQPPSLPPSPSLRGGDLSR